MAAEILINVRPQETRVAFVEGGVLTDLKIERQSSRTLVGSVHRGRVTRVLPGMQAAFVDIGLEKAGFLYVGDIKGAEEEGLPVDDADDLESAEDLTGPADRSGSSRVPIQDLVREGQHLLVQVAKDPLGTKGARLTTHISLPGRYVVYLPANKNVGVSRRIESEKERDRLKNLVSQMNLNGGVIVRTAGEGASEENLRTDIEFLDRMSREIFKAYDKKKNAGLLHQELDVELRALRDLLSEEVSTIWVDDPEVHKRVVRFAHQMMPKGRTTVNHYQDRKPLFDMYDIDLEISRSMDRKIWLKSGGYIVIDEAEALVVIDINTGRFIGKKDLEDTILKTNLEAVKEIAHQLRIRNCGGIIIIDFIDMERESHREKVMTALRDEVRRDRSRTQIFSMSELGLVQMTRKRTRPSLIKELCEPCSYCEGKAYIKRRSTVAHEIFRELERDWARVTPQTNILVHCHGTVIDWIYESESETLAMIESRLGRSVAFKLEPNYHSEEYEIFFH